MQTKIQRSNERGHASHGWLNTYHSFSFGHWYEPSKVHFGALRVLNDDEIKAGEGFGTHPHDNMEIVTIPLSGSVAHKDSTGTDGIIKTGDVQIMSAGTGIRHSEFNGSKTEDLSLLQIWVIPKEENIKPRYDQKTFDIKDRNNTWQVVVSPSDKNALWINQDCIFALSHLEAGKDLSYKNQFNGSGVYLFVIEGGCEVNGQQLGKRDAMEITDADGFEIKALEAADLLVIEVPMLK